MSKQLQQLHTLTAKATIAHKMYSAGLITKEDFKKQLNDIDCRYDSLRIDKLYFIHM